ncbi:ABC transporter permease [Phenylobacterium sp.]|uniref:ABC transporter permease n=1 Tax=Phenylobacterium sp. TaxID=1871053 RepID=UPI0035B3E6CE
MGINLRMAMRALTQNKLQALLTLLGMSMGVAMVVIVSGLGRGAQLRIEAQIEAAGPTRVTIRPGNFTPAAIDTSGRQDNSGGEQSEGSVGFVGADGQLPNMTRDAAAKDARQRMTAVRRTLHRTPPSPLGQAEMDMLRGLDGVRSVAGAVEGNVSVDPQAGLPVYVVRVHGFESDWPDMAGWKLLSGKMISASEHARNEPVMLVTPQAAKRLWPTADSVLGQTIPIGGRQVRVVGLVRTGDEDGGVVPSIYLPVKLAQGLLKRDSYDDITVRTASVGVTTAVAKDIQDKLRALHKLPDDTLNDFRVESQSISALPSMGADPHLVRAVHSNTAELDRASWEQMAKSLRQAGRTFTLLLAGAAAVSLLVGGIGVMNIMLVSVTARTREIGLRMALGARAGDVMMQFLVEAVTLAALGGLLGLGLGGIGLMITDHGLHWATAASPTMLAAALAMAAITGVVFGIAPARRAAFLDPVVALKSE